MKMAWKVLCFDDPQMVNKSNNFKKKGWVVWSITCALHMSMKALSTIIYN